MTAAIRRRASPRCWTATATRSSRRPNFDRPCKAPSRACYAAADTNRDGQLSPAELNAAVIGMANAAAQAAFQAADADHNGALSQAEFDKAIQGPANTLFRIVDANGDGQITPQEAQAAQNVLMSQIKMLQVPEPGNSAKSLIEGASPRAAAPVPTFTAPRPATAPAPRQQ